MVDVGVPDDIAEMNAQAVTLFADGDSDWVTDDVPSILGRAGRTFEQFVVDHVASFSGTPHEPHARAATTKRHRGESHDTHYHDRSFRDTCRKRR